MATYQKITAIVTIVLCAVTAMAIRHFASLADRPGAERDLSGKATEFNVSRGDTSALFPPLPAPGPGDWLARHHEKGQTFEQFLTGPRNRLTSRRNKIYLQPLWRFDSRRSPSLHLLKEFTQTYFGLPVVLLAPIHPEENDFSPRTNPLTHNAQVNADDILRFLRQRVPPDAYCVLAITMADLYPDPAWNFVFGYASYDDRVGVFSFARHDPAFYGGEHTEGGRELLLLRSCKILAHETGHMFGMAHCIAYHCVMNGSNHLEESDAQPIHLCPVCLKKLRHVVGFDQRRRYETLGGFYGRLGYTALGKWVQQRLSALLATCRHRCSPPAGTEPGANP